MKVKCLKGSKTDHFVCILKRIRDFAIILALASGPFIVTEPRIFLAPYHFAVEKGV